MKNEPPNQGEGDRASARHYNRQVRELIADVERAGGDARRFLEHEPEETERTERPAKRGPKGTRVSVDELVAKGRSILVRVVDRVRSRFGHK